jgi:hypothetical protein
MFAWKLFHRRQNCCSSLMFPDRSVKQQCK